MLHKSNFFRSYGLWHWGEGFQTVLFTWYMAFHANLSATEIGFYQALVLSPFLIFTIIGGAITDKVGAKLSYTVSTGLFATILIAYGILDHEAGYTSTFFFIYCVLAGIVSAVSNPSIDTFIPEATSKGSQENSLLAATTHNVGKLTGTITALALPFISSIGGFIFNGLLMIASVVFLAKHKKKEAPLPEVSKVSRPAKHGLLRSIISHYKGCPENFDILLSSGLLGLLVVPTGYILVPLVLRERLPEHGDMIAFVYISFWIGAISSTAIAHKLSAKIVLPGKTALLLWAGFALILLMLIIVNHFILLCLLVMILGGEKVGKPLVYGRYLHNCPEDQRGVLISVDQTAFWGLATIGTFGLGLMVDSFGLNTTIVFNTIAMIAGVGILALRGNLTRMKAT